MKQLYELKYGRNFSGPKKLIDEEIDRLLFEDESMIRDYQAIGSALFSNGKQ
ncbi:hypothetical protein [Sporosarcina sp. BP05]|uniref:hypothetical protein n=1 Tax=Sporosarcina sp. BP05 TaxID=2758726 RepID=UPI00164621E7|nr:hypothetical protein [Sporosarcina sp. BP05]